MNNVLHAHAMKVSSVLLGTALLAPSAILFGLGAAAAFSLAAGAGLIAIAVADYGRPSPHLTSRRLAPSRPTRVERLPLAA